jgi:hypothetical protein
MVRTMRVAVGFDLYVGDSVDQNDCGEGLSCSTKVI